MEKNVIIFYLKSKYTIYNKYFLVFKNYLFFNNKKK